MEVVVEADRIERVFCLAIQLSEQLLSYFVYIWLQLHHRRKRVGIGCVTFHSRVHRFVLENEWIGNYAFFVIWRRGVIE